MIEYYFKLEDASNRNLKQLKKLLEPIAINISNELSTILNKDIRYYWTMKNTFGFIFTDFEWSHDSYQRLIGRGEKDLFEKIKNDYRYVILSNIIDRNFKIGKLDDKKRFIIINLSHFREFLNIIRDRTNTVRLFLYKFENKNQEDLIRTWLKNYEKFEEIKEEELISANIDSMIEIIRRYSISNASDLEKFILIGIESMKQISSKINLFEEKLNKFKEYIDNDVDETTIHNFLFDNIWLIDFQYLLYRKEKKEQLDVGQPDISVYKDAFGINKIGIVELKRSDQEIVTEKYRGKKPVILSEVGKAISQTIHYLEELKAKNRVLEGIVIVGKKKEIKDTFIDRFNQYLHGIKVMTYDEIYENARNIVDAFK